MNFTDHFVVMEPGSGYLLSIVLSIGMTRTHPHFSGYTVLVRGFTIRPFRERTLTGGDISGVGQNNSCVSTSPQNLWRWWLLDQILIS